MKAITNREKWPKFLVVNDIPEQRVWNKYLLKPYKKGEIVKVAPFDEQKRDDAFDDPLRFRQRYVVVYRKVENGKFTLKYIQDWKSFDSLIKSK